MRNLICLTLVAIALNACAAGPLVLQNPKTGQIVQCSGNGIGLERYYGNQDCANAYASLGYKQVNPD